MESFFYNELDRIEDKTWWTVTNLKRLVSMYFSAFPLLYIFLIMYYRYYQLWNKKHKFSITDKHISKIIQD